MRYTYSTFYLYYTCYINNTCTGCLKSCKFVFTITRTRVAGLVLKHLSVKAASTRPNDVRLESTPAITNYFIITRTDFTVPWRVEG